MRILSIHKIHSTLEIQLSKAGFIVDTIYDLERKDILKILHKYDGLVVRSALKVDKEVLDAGINLKFVARLGAGMENIDDKVAKAKQIKLISAPEGNRTAVGEHALGMLLCLLNNINIADLEVRKGVWQREENRGEELEGKTIGIIGYGNMGSSFAQKLSGFGVKIIAFDKYKKDFGNNIVNEVDLPQIFKETDILSLHVPLQEDTKYMVDEKFINSFKKEIILINTARGSVLQTSALVKALKNGKIKGACLDVLEYEGLSFENIEKTTQVEDFKYLKNSKKVLLTPHIAGWTHQSDEKMAQVLADKIISNFA